uniref:ATP synthase complex subunit 8 n=1 Tax=Dinornis novaezealandiae TaxID=8818 RepID=Q4TW06_DINNV|nr:adenine triphosphatase subunit 8 [Dinornis novaezealandiae]AAY41371.1 adenine triphosphatase subunit 8 [Dinornis novaezealandiae]AAY41373.1 adenine triphosphatase subunit 8 [Dinornis novaezealandiae]
MPQLNPYPWFSILLMVWLILLLLIQPKFLSFIHTNPPSNKTKMAPIPPTWTWPWT